MLLIDPRAHSLADRFDGNLPDDTPGSTHPGNPTGCDSNADGIVDSGDVSCTILIIYNGPGSCG